MLCCGRGGRGGEYVTLNIWSEVECFTYPSKVPKVPTYLTLFIFSISWVFCSVLFCLCWSGGFCAWCLGFGSWVLCILSTYLSVHLLMCSSIYLSIYQSIDQSIIRNYLSVDSFSEKSMSYHSIWEAVKKNYIYIKKTCYSILSYPMLILFFSLENRTRISVKLNV